MPTADLARSAKVAERAIYFLRFFHTGSGAARRRAVRTVPCRIARGVKEPSRKHTTTTVLVVMLA